MPRIDLLRSLPKTKRNIGRRKDAKEPRVVRVAKQFGQAYFDGERIYGYGGYKYDGRWRPVARDIVHHFNLKYGEHVLDIGCAKGFLVRDMLDQYPSLEVFGLDISPYAVRCSAVEVAGRLHVGNALDLPFPSNSFDCVLSINTLHNLDKAGVIQALLEIKRVMTPEAWLTGRAFIQVDSYHTPEQKALFEDWVLTAEFHDYPAGWERIFEDVGYKGWYDWTVIT